MNIQDYVVAAGRTLPRLGTLKNDLIHMHCGVITETGELVDALKRKLAYKKEYDITNVKEEIGDVAWYLANTVYLYGEYGLKHIQTFFTMHQPVENKTLSLEDVLHKLQILSWGYRSVLDDSEYSLENKNIATVSQMGVYLNSLKQIAEFFQVNFEECLDLNIKKLQTRYPDKFTTEAANNRNLEAERAVLEQ